MRLTPLDIHQKEFNRSLRGFDEREVDAFLDQVADEIERLFKENIDLTERNELLEEKVRQYQDMERTLHNALLSAQKSADDLLRTSREEADAILKDAEVKAKDIVHEALITKQKTTSNLRRLKQAEEDFRASFKHLLEHYLSGISEVSLPEDVTLVAERVGEELIAAASVRRPILEPVSEPESLNAADKEESSVAAAPRPHKDAGDASPKAKSGAPSSNERVASLHLGEIDDDIDVDATVEFNVADFGFGERENDLDIESID